jgi:glycosyltransferase involved in cell wall biosynthesis
MKILNISSYELSGCRFNGFINHLNFRKEGIDSTYLVWTKEGNDANTKRLFDNKYRDYIHGKTKHIEDKYSIQSLLYPFAFLLPFKKYFYKSNVIHYHLIHNFFFSLFALPILTRIKPTIWTLHDPWALTGHCRYPQGCKKWQSGCKGCPDLEAYFPMKKDNARLMWKIKKYIYKLSKFHLVVASEWMLSMVEDSPLFYKFPIHLIPFGIDLNTFYPMDSNSAKSKLGLNDNFTILFRATNNEVKGFSFVAEFLKGFSKLKYPKINILTVEQNGLLDDLKEFYGIKEFGWVYDESQMNIIFNAADVFLMPSTAESFGLMAIEAMACAKPVIVFEGTSLPQVVYAPEGGICVERSGDAILRTIELLIRDPEYRKKIGNQAYEIVLKKYDYKIHYQKIKELYKTVSKKEW